MQLLRQGELDAQRALLGLAAAVPCGAPCTAPSASQSITGVAAHTASPPAAAAPVAVARAVAHAPPQRRCAQCHQPFRAGMQCLELCCSRGCRALLHFDCGCSAALGSVVLVWQDSVRRRFKLDPALRCLTALAGGEAACDGVTVRARMLPAEMTVHSAAAAKVLFDEREAAARREAAEAARAGGGASDGPKLSKNAAKHAKRKAKKAAGGGEDDE